MDQPRITPRSPRTALEPEQIRVPTRRSKRARHPLVIIGNAIITLLVLVVLAAGAGLFIGKQRFDAPGPLVTEKVVNIPPSGVNETADQLTRAGVIVLGAQGQRSPMRNREEALERLVALVREAARPPTPRKKTRVSKAAKRRRVDDKKHHGAVKSLRRTRADD